MLSYQGSHQKEVRWIKKRSNDGRREIFWMDVEGRPKTASVYMNPDNIFRLHCPLLQSLVAVVTCRHILTWLLFLKATLAQ